MPYSDKEKAVLQKYRILNADGSPRTCNITEPLHAGGKPEGPGPIMAQNVINRLLKADTTKDRRWLDWIFYQAGGGDLAKEASEEALQRLKDMFLAVS